MLRIKSEYAGLELLDRGNTPISLKFLYKKLPLVPFDNDEYTSPPSSLSILFPHHNITFTLGTIHVLLLNGLIWQNKAVYQRKVCTLSFGREKLTQALSALWHGESISGSEWRGVQVVDYDSTREQYHVVWDSKDTPSWEPRVNVMFLAEDPFNFVNRIAAAHSMRQNAEMLLVSLVGYYPS